MGGKFQTPDAVDWKLFAADPPNAGLAVSWRPQACVAFSASIFFATSTRCLANGRSADVAVQLPGTLARRSLDEGCTKPSSGLRDDDLANPHVNIKKNTIDWKVGRKFLKFTNGW